MFGGGTGWGGGRGNRGGKHPQRAPLAFPLPPHLFCFLSETEVEINRHEIEIQIPGRLLPRLILLRSISLRRRAKIRFPSSRLKRNARQCLSSWLAHRINALLHRIARPPHRQPSPWAASGPSCAVRRDTQRPGRGGVSRRAATPSNNGWLLLDACAGLPRTRGMTTSRMPIRLEVMPRCGVPQRRSRRSGLPSRPRQRVLRRSSAPCHRRGWSRTTSFIGSKRRPRRALTGPPYCKRRSRARAPHPSDASKSC